MQCAAVFFVFPDMLIDALVTDKGDAILHQTAADLIGTPLLLRQFLLDQLHQVRRHFAWLVRGLLASLRGLLVRLLEAIAARPLLRTSSRLIVDGSTPIFRAMWACEWPLCK